MSGELRMVSIQGGAASSYLNEGRRGRRSNTRKTARHQDGGFDTAPGPSMSAAGANAMVRNATRTLRGGSAAPMDPKLIAAPSVAALTPPAPSVPASSASAASPSVPPPALSPAVTGGGKVLVLAPKKKSSRLHLAPPKHGRRKVLQTRKIRVHLSGLKKRITQAKTIHKDSRTKSIEEIRTLLEEARLIKPAKENKKVPDSVLRDIYKDYMLLRGRAL